MNSIKIVKQEAGKMVLHTEPIPAKIQTVNNFHLWGMPCHSYASKVAKILFWSNLMV